LCGGWQAATRTDEGRNCRRVEKSAEPDRPAVVLFDDHRIDVDRSFKEVARVEIYVKSTCGFCFRALQLLESKGVDYEAYELTWGSPLREEMIQRANGRTTVPQIFIDGKHVGGCDDLYALDRAGKLAQLLAA
jgi:glutaredoxin 3